ncbi:MAG TPA: metalloregulator ArsR/SmtB family transcription factor [Chloroflexota bacterium]|nr:metalloregulator ArsR/SmtB family transcription factor [Chloroflexota bacterium]
MSGQERRPTPMAATELTARFFTGLADPTRLRIVEALLERPHTVGEIVTRLGLRQARVSNALICLKWCGYVWYRVSDPRIRDLVALARTVMADHAAQIACCTRLDAGGALLGAGDDAPRSAGA